MRFVTRDFGTEPKPGEVLLIDSQDIWLALDDSENDSRRRILNTPYGLALTIEPTVYEDLETYQRQLFYWLLTRARPCAFAPLARPRVKAPAGIDRKN